MKNMVGCGRGRTAQGHGEIQQNGEEEVQSSEMILPGWVSLVKWDHVFSKPKLQEETSRRNGIVSHCFLDHFCKCGPWLQGSLFLGARVQSSRCFPMLAPLTVL